MSGPDLFSCQKNEETVIQHGVGNSWITKIHELDLNGFALTRLLPEMGVDILRQRPDWFPQGTIDAAALTRSDNTAGNWILKTVGGPKGLTAFARSVGDETFRLDRWETELNDSTPGDERDTTTPLAMAKTLRKLALGDALTGRSRARLIAWMEANKSGGAKLKAGPPDDWMIADKTGGGEYGTMADIAVIQRPGSDPLTVAVYMKETEASFDDRNAGIANIARALADRYRI